MLENALMSTNKDVSGMVFIILWFAWRGPSIRVLLLPQKRESRDLLLSPDMVL